MKFSSAEMKLIRNCVEITGQVAKTHYSLGSRVAFLKVIDTANMGLLQIGHMGSGKTKAMECLAKYLMHKDGVISQEFTMAGTDEDINKKFTNKSITWISKDLAKLSTNVVENMLKVACSILTDHSCQVKTSMYNCDITNSIISWLGACTFEIYNALWDSPIWRGNYMDRLMRLYVYSYGRKEVNWAIPKVTGGKHMFNPMPDEDEVEIGGVSDAYYKRIFDIFNTQFSEERSEEYIERILRGVAMMNHRKEAFDADAKFLLLFEFNLKSESIIGRRDTVSAPLYIDTDPLVIFSLALKKKGITVSEVSKKRQTTIESVEETLDAYPELLRVKGSIGNRHIFIPEKILKDYFVPQLAFEKKCLGIVKQNA